MNVGSWDQKQEHETIHMGINQIQGNRNRNMGTGTWNTNRNMETETWKQEHGSRSRRLKQKNGNRTGLASQIYLHYSNHGGRWDTGEIHIPDGRPVKPVRPFGDRWNLFGQMGYRWNQNARMGYRWNQILGVATDIPARRRRAGMSVAAHSPIRRPVEPVRGFTVCLFGDRWNL